jgi:hypothetical protein
MLMKTTMKRVSLAVPSLVLAVTTLVSVPVFAQHGSDDGTGDVATSGTSGSHDGTTSGATTTTTGTTTETETETHDQTELHHQGSQLVTELEKENHGTKTAEEKTKACESHKHGLTTKFSRITANSQKLEDKIGTFLTRAETYQSTNNITVTDWTTLVSNADAAKTKVDTSIANLKAVTPTMDCNSTTVAQDVPTSKPIRQP